MHKDIRSQKQVRNSGTDINILKILICIVLGIIIVAQAEHIVEGLSFAFENVINLNYELTKTIITQIGLALITYTLIDSIFTVRKNREISKRIDDFALKLGENIEKLQYSVGITQGALDTGLSAVKATRNDAIKEIKANMDEIISKCNENDSQKYKIKILGISLGDYLCPHGPLYHEFKELINKKNVQIQILILKDGSHSAIQRAKIEENYVFQNNRKFASEIIEKESVNGGICYPCEKYEIKASDPEKNRECKFGNVKSNMKVDAIDCYSYMQTKCHNELRTATLYLYNLCKNEERIERDFIEKKGKKKTSLDGEIQQWNHKWDNIKAYDYAPLLLMIEFEDTMFVENYHLSSGGGESPVLQIRKGTNLFQIYDNHFRMLFDDLGLSDHIDSCSCLNKACSFGAAIADKIETKKSEEAIQQKVEKQNYAKSLVRNKRGEDSGNRLTGSQDTGNE